MQISENSRPKRENRDFGLENALAGYVRRRWPDKTIPNVSHHFDLSESEAAKVVYAQTSKNLLKKLLHHPQGGFALFVELLADACGTTLEQHIQRQAEEARNERARWEAEERRLTALASRVPGLGGDRGRLVEPAWGRRPKDARVGRSQDPRRLNQPD
jgi:hypothetical protein